MEKIKMNVFTPPQPTVFHIQLYDILQQFSIQVDNLIKKIKEFIAKFQNNKDAQAAVSAAHTMLAEKDTHSLLDIAYRVSFLQKTGQFAEVNTLLRSIAYENYAEETDTLLFMAQTAVTCGLFDVIGYIQAVIGNISQFNDINNVVWILNQKSTKPVELESIFFAAKNWLHQQGVDIFNIGFWYTLLDDPFFALNIYITEQDLDKFCDIDDKLTTYLIDFEKKYKIDLGDTLVHICGVWELPK